MSKTRFSVAVTVLLALGAWCSAAPAADPEAIRRQQEQQRLQQLQQERERLDQQIRAGQQQLEQARNQAERIRNSIPNLEKQYQEATRQAEQFKPKVESQQQEVEQARASQKAAADKARDARNQLTAVADRLEKAQPAEAPIVLAKNRMQQVQQRYDEQLKRLLESSEYKRAFQAALDTGDRTKAAEVRSSFVSGNPELVGLQRELKTSREAYEAERKQVVASHPDYQRAEESLKSAQADTTEAGKKLDQAIKKHGQAKSALADKVAVARKSAALGNQATANIKRLETAQQRISQQIQQLQSRRNNLR